MVRTPALPLFWALVGLAVFVPTSVLAASPTVYEQDSPPAKALGRSIGGGFKTGVSNSPLGSQQFFSSVSLKILGAALQALTALNTPPNTIDGVTYTEVYSFGKRVFSQSGYFKNGKLGFTAGLAPTEVRVPLLVYPVGPVTVTVDGGVRFQADVQGSLIPNIGVPASLSSVDGQLDAIANGAGFIEGYAKFLVIRGGVGGQVNLVNAQADLNARLSADGSPPYFSVNAMIDFLSGKLYAFLDYFNPASFSFKRLLDYSLYSWKGSCFATGAMLCP